MNDIHINGRMAAIIALLTAWAIGFYTDPIAAISGLIIVGGYYAAKYYLNHHNNDQTGRDHTNV